MPDSDKMDAMLKLIIGSTFCLVVILIVSLILYSLVFVPQPMNGIAPADKQFFFNLVGHEQVHSWLTSDAIGDQGQGRVYTAGLVHG